MVNMVNMVEKQAGCIEGCSSLVWMDGGRSISMTHLLII
jgi:hypothetical protein